MMNDGIYFNMDDQKMGILTCLYRPMSTSLHDATEIVNAIHPGWIARLDSMRMQSGNQLSEIIPLTQALRQTKSGRVFKVFHANDELDLGGVYSYREVLHVNQKRESSYIFIYNASDTLNEFTEQLLSDNFASINMTCDYGFSRQWGGDCVKAYEYSTGVRVALSFNDLIDDQPSESAKWAKLYIYDPNKEWMTKLRDIYPVNFLSKDRELGHGKIVAFIESDPGIFGKIINLDKNHVIWVPNFEKIDDIRVKLHDFLIPNMR